MSTRQFACLDRLAAWRALVVVVVLFAGCSSEKPTTPVSGGRGSLVVAADARSTDRSAQATPEECLQSLRLAYQGRNSVEYRQLFANDFTFVFDPVDVNDPDNPTPISWGLADELSSAQRMFASESVDLIQLNFTLAAPVPVPGDPRTVRVLMNNVYLQVYTHNASGEPLVFLVEGGTQQFYLRPFPVITEARQRVIWKIVQWEDLGPAASRTEDNSWGRIKNYFR
jgi:hypothetical protein